MERNNIPRFSQMKGEATPGTTKVNLSSLMNQEISIEETRVQVEKLKASASQLVKEKIKSIATPDLLEKKIFIDATWTETSRFSNNGLSINKSKLLGLNQQQNKSLVNSIRDRATGLKKGMSMCTENSNLKMTRTNAYF